MQKVPKKKKKKRLFPKGATREQKMDIAAQRLSRSHARAVSEFGSDYYYSSGPDRKIMRNTGGNSLLNYYAAKTGTAVNSKILTKKSSALARRMFELEARAISKSEAEKAGARPAKKKKVVKKAAKKKAAKKKKVAKKRSRR